MEVTALNFEQTKEISDYAKQVKVEFSAKNAIFVWARNSFIEYHIR